MSQTNTFIFTGLKVVAWIIFVGLCIEAGGLLMNFIFSVFKPEFIGNLYQKLDLTALYTKNSWAFYGMYSFVLFIAMLKAYLFYLVIVLITKIDLEKPFNQFVAKQITKISYYTFSIGLISYIGKQSARNLQYSGYDLSMLKDFWSDAQAFILMAAVIYVIATIFSKGVAYQDELEETV